jgi:DNA polymerase elongation subunit (family B)
MQYCTKIASNSVYGMCGFSGNWLYRQELQLLCCTIARDITKFVFNNVNAIAMANPVAADTDGIFMQLTDVDQQETINRVNAALHEKYNDRVMFASENFFSKLVLSKNKKQYFGRIMGRPDSYHIR